MYDFDVISSYITAFFLTYFIIPPIIAVAMKKGLCDEPGERSSHTVRTPRLGGLAIFAGVIFSMTFWIPFGKYGGDLQFVLCAFILIFLIGVKDDLDGTSPTTKLFFQLFAALVLFFRADIRITSLYGIMGIYQISPVWSAILTIFTIIVIINAMNLIDGINGLSGTLTLIITVTLGAWFLLIKRYDLSIMAFSAAGASTAFLKYNYTPAKIFMGDTGSLLLGTICSILAIQFIELNEMLDTYDSLRINAAPGVAIGILILPLFDTLRVFLTRIYNGKHPLHPDRTHIHHLMIDTGFSHSQATAILAICNIFFIGLVFLLQRYTRNTLLIVALVGSIATVLASGLYYSTKKRMKTAN